MSNQKSNVKTKIVAATIKTPSGEYLTISGKDYETYTKRRNNMTGAKYVDSFDGAKIYTRLWDETKNPRGVVLIIHGMSEHSARYDEFSKFLNKNDYVCFAFDLRAHGKTSVNIESLGKYDGDLFMDSVNDAIFFSHLLNELYPSLPLLVFGHSFGSFLLQRYVECYDQYKGVIFCGSANMKNDSSVSLGLFVSGFSKFFCGKNKPSKLIAKLSFGAYAKKFEDGNWLSRDKKECEKYKKDDYCGFICSHNFYHSFFKNLKAIYKKDNLAQINTRKPMLIISGSDDPVGGFSRLSTKLDELYTKLGVKNKKFILYKGARHELLNETNKKEVFENILTYLDNCTEKSVERRKTAKNA